MVIQAERKKTRCTVKPFTNHLYRSTTPLYRSLYSGYIQCIGMIFQLPKPTTSLNRPFKVGPMVGRFGEVLLYFSLVFLFVFVPVGLLFRGGSRVCVRVWVGMCVCAGVSCVSVSCVCELGACELGVCEL